MKKYFLGFIVIFALSTSPLFANNIFIEGGPGIGKSWHSEAALLRYQRDTSRLFNHPSYYEAVLAHWDHENRSTGLGIARGVVRNIPNDGYLTGAFGLMGLSRRTEHLGTAFQFYSRFAYGFKIHNRDISLAIIHISNGKVLFRWDGPNSGENFITFSIGLFK